MFSSGQVSKGFNFRNFLPYIVLVVASFGFVISNVAQHSQAFSPLDEWVYYDYVVKVPEQGFVHAGEKIGNDALYRMSCFGDADGPSGQPCEGPNAIYDQNEDYSFEGISSAADYTPLYFWSTWAVAEFAHQVSGVDFFGLARATGMIWLALGMIFWVKIARKLEITDSLAVAIGLGFLALPISYYAFTFITTDAPMFFLGGLLIYLSLKVVRDELSPYWIVPVSLIGFVFKGSFLLVELFIAALIATSTIYKIRKSPEPGSWKTALPPALSIVLMFVSSLLFNKFWGQFVSANAVGSTPDQGGEVPFTPRPFLDGIFALIPDLTGGKSQNLMDYTSAPLSILLILGLFGVLFINSLSSQQIIFTRVTAVATVIIIPLLALAYFIQSGYTIPIEPRYGLVLYGALLAPIGMFPQNKLGHNLVLIVGIFSGLIAITGLVQPLG